MQVNMLDMPVFIIIGASFSGVVNSLVNDLLMPPLGLLHGGADFSELFWLLKIGDPAGPYTALTLAKEAGAVAMNYGLFINTIINFLVVAVSLFLVIRTMNRMREGEGEEAEE
jgi:large conductance mechanosensitive channel